MGKVSQAARGRELAPATSPARGIKDLLASQWPRIEAVMPRHMSSERLYQLAVSTINQNPKLAECDVASLLSCVMKCSALGLEPSAVDGLGRAYILPYRNKGQMTATFIMGYKGMIDLARRSGEIRDISARAVYEGDEFDYGFGLDEYLQHRPARRRHDAEERPTHVYMVAHFKDGGHYMDVMTIDEVEAVRKRSRAANNGPWVTDYEAMAKKTVIRRAFPYLPVSVEAQTAAAADETTPDYIGTLNPVIDAEDGAEIGYGGPEGAAEPQQDAQAYEEPPEPEIPPVRAVCRSCGNSVEVAPDATADDLNQMVCCEHPDYVME